MGWNAKGSQWEFAMPLASAMRRKPTAAESVLWTELRDRRLCGARFRRQHAIGRYIVDFYCAAHRLVVEVDGEVHADRRDLDDERDAYLGLLELRVLRFDNNDVLRDPRAVLARIARALVPTPKPRRP
jgi:very-short-patch-repair endonuclease